MAALRETVSGRDSGAAAAAGDLKARADGGDRARSAACLVAELALRSGVRVPLADIGALYGLPRLELACIAAVLADAGILRPAPGPGGVWALCANPRRLSLGDVMRLFPAPETAAPAGPETAVALAVAQRIAEARRLSEAALGTITIQSLLARLEAHGFREPPEADASPCAAPG
ncbi:Rrf2 family transcriptional regulator [Xanthobacter sp. KR7-225]|uniref:Rrf2 family transcriptional regulator n=1 Tax=Xanthobacter sp. KR7-225 TaxID=3156613 RepID=UPI0032B35EF0